MNGTVFNIQRFSLYDGFGVRTVVFLKGCPLRCLWCHNPEGLKREPQIMFNASRCIGCGDCAEVCKSSCHTLRDGVHFFDPSACGACGACAESCYADALTLTGKEMSAEEVMEEVMRDVKIYRETGGGLTLSGGEPLLQADFALELLRMAKEAGISTSLETSGFASSEVIGKVAEYTDLFLYDYKATGEDEHKRLCGVSNKRILENLSLLDDLGATVILRCPIIPGINDNSTHFDGIAATATAHACIKEVHLEPYHRLGIDKAAQLGAAVTFDAEPPRKTDMADYCRMIEALCGKKVSVS